MKTQILFVGLLSISFLVGCANNPVNAGSSSSNVDETSRTTETTNVEKPTSTTSTTSENDDIVTIYFQDESWWNKDAAGVGAYLWNSKVEDSFNAIWPGVRANHISFNQTGEEEIGFNYWSIEVDLTKYDMLIFTRINSEGDIQDWGAKTVDISLNERGENNMYSILGSTPIWGDPGVSGTWTSYTD